MKNTFPLMLCLLAFISFCSCTSVKVTTDYDKSVDFSKYKTYTIYKLTTNGESISDLNKDRIINAIKAEMARKGFTEAETDPDLLVHATTALISKKNVTATTNYYRYNSYYRPYSWGPNYGGTVTYNEYNYKEGTLIIDILDANSKKLIWQGIGDKEIDKPSKDIDKKINEAVAGIMDDFPPGK
jgi:hypothetical protein